MQWCRPKLMRMRTMSILNVWSRKFTVVIYILLRVITAECSWIWFLKKLFVRIKIILKRYGQKLLWNRSESSGYIHLWINMHFLMFQIVLGSKTCMLTVRLHKLTLFVIFVIFISLCWFSVFANKLDTVRLDCFIFFRACS